ncbi:hypothetical protein [Candidatus Uabimicrobium amorphum]|uniref:Uncharacterized protein n=1 Tax=Uabimicrobium amorphum TaxID=2596890 RepID=A0A5S9F3N4_UABAM|nr:hypothetical protein [Candidatus Uabimicrobium amorphum]BBM83352.1 hypothetical protein UABAM_01704 [Candidatus Uabimicrobium amorphum]
MKQEYGDTQKDKFLDGASTTGVIAILGGAILTFGAQTLKWLSNNSNSNQDS